MKEKKGYLYKHEVDKQEKREAIAKARHTGR